MTMRYARWGIHALAGLSVLVLVAALLPMLGQAQVSVLNYFAQTTGTDNILNIDGTMEFEDKVTVIDHGTATLANGYATVTTNLSSTVTCTFALNAGAALPTASTVTVTGLWTTGSSTLEILGGTGTTDKVGYACFGAD